MLVLETGANDGLRGIPPATLRDESRDGARPRAAPSAPTRASLLVQMEALPNLGPEVRVGLPRRRIPTVAQEKG